MGFNIGPRVLKATGGSISRAGNYRIHQFPPDIVTDGLVMHLDTGNVGSLAVDDATTITDLTGNGNNGAILNGAAYNHNYGGTILMNPSSSTNDYINVTNGSNVMSKDFTLDFWLRYTDINSGAYTNIWSTAGYNSGGDGFAFYSYGSEIRIWGWNVNGGSNSMLLNPTGVLANNTWYNIVITRDLNTEKLICYKNAVALGTATGVTCDYEKTTDGTYSFGTRDGSTYPFDGYTSGVRAYNRALSPAEILQNYEATKLRHSTNYSGTFNPTCAGSGGKVDVLCIAGGGGGGTQHGGGGGAGGYQETSGLTIVSGGTYTAIVGAGGTGSEAGGSFNRPNGTNGGNSVFSGTSITTMTSVGGGGGACIRTSGNNGSAGGSGGGAGLEGNGAGANTTSGGAGTSGQGFAGGKHGGYSGTNYGGGAGGGGAGGVGQDGINGPSYIAGAGGPGKTSSITGSAVMRAGGGGGGSHAPFIYGSATGGGGRGGSGNTFCGDNAIPRTGSGGGGGGGMTETGGSGAHGIIILRYPAEDYNVEALIIGGGGSGGSGSDYAYSGGGGGAGGLIYYSNLSISSGKNYEVHIGKGGASRPANTYHSSNNVSGQDGFNGKNTIFDDKIAIGGGFGGGGLSRAGNSGGSGGGSGGRNNSGGKGTPTQGHDGGDSSEHGDTTTRGGGGGGAGSAGGDGSNTVNGTFGDGLEFSITGSSVTYAQGGGGGYLGITQAQTPGQGGRGANGDGGATSEPNTATGAWDGAVYIAYKGPQRGEGGTIDQTSRPGYTIHKFTDAGPDRFIG
tara:strand:+ start:30 stop:2393 length:2364 start_codon:yes stop_codon:yes gene_type:complete